MRIHVGIPQIIYMTWTAIALLLYARDHGKPKRGNDNFWVALIASCLTYSLLIWGGFFR